MSRSFREFARRLNDEAMRYGRRARAQGGIDGLVTVAVGEALMRAAHMAQDTAKAMEAASGTSGSAQDAQRLDPKGAGPVPKADAQSHPSNSGEAE